PTSPATASNPDAGERRRARSAHPSAGPPPPGLLGVDQQRPQQLHAVPVLQRGVRRRRNPEYRGPDAFRVVLESRGAHRVGDRRAGGKLHGAQLVPPWPCPHHLDAHHSPLSATRTKSSTIRSARPWKPTASAGASIRTVGSKSSVSVTRQADSSRAWNSQSPDRRRKGPSTRRMSMLRGGVRTFSVVNQVRRPPRPRSSRATIRPGPSSSTRAPSHQRNRRG